MNRSTRSSLSAKIAVALLCAACLCLGAATGVASAKKGSEAGVHFTTESTQAYEQQLASGQIQAAKFNTKVRSMHLTLKDGQHMLVNYPPHGEAKLVAELKAQGVSVPAIKPAKHKLRYIAAGVLVIVLILIGVVLYMRRKRGEEF
jgi:ATP-dependent Zn protease